MRAPLATVERVWIYRCRASMVGSVYDQLSVDNYWAVERSQRAKVIRVVRQSGQMTCVDEVDRSFETVRDALVGIRTKHWGMILDMRLAKPSHDDAVEKAMRRNRKSLSDRFRRTAVLLRTAAGALQVQRLLKGAPDPRIGVFTSEDEALAWAGRAD